jgi:Holliday junction resolvase RusA-like endonuclease
MPKVCEFVVYGIAQPKGSTRPWIKVLRDKETGERKTIVRTTSANLKLKPWEDDIRAAIQNAAPGIFFEKDAAVSLRIVFWMPRPKSLVKRILHHLTAPDLSKLVRGAEDALTGKLWADDSQVVHVNAWKLYTTEQPRAEYRIVEIDQPITAHVIEQIEADQNFSLPW